MSGRWNLLRAYCFTGKPKGQGLVGKLAPHLLNVRVSRATLGFYRPLHVPESTARTVCIRLYQCQRVALPTSCDNGCTMSVSPSHMSWYGAVQQVLAVKLYLHTQRVGHSAITTRSWAAAALVAGCYQTNLAQQLRCVASVTGIAAQHFLLNSIGGSAQRTRSTQQGQRVPALQWVFWVLLPMLFSIKCATRF